MNTTAEVLANLDKRIARRQANHVLHGHPSPIFWRERDIDMREWLARRRENNRVVPKRVGLYVATPYCLPTKPDRCGFCLFPSETYRGPEQLNMYLDHLEKEAQMLRPLLDEDVLGGIYLGGGTANLYNADGYKRLMDIACSAYSDVPESIEVTLEGIPQLFTRQKLVAAKEAGVNRVSIGVQQIEDEMIALTGRKQKAKHVFNTLNWCNELGLVTSVDLIFGWPGQTAEQMLSDLEKMVAAGVRHITHYELNVAGRSDFAKNHRDSLPSIEENLQLYHLSKSFLRSHGYEQGSVYDWEKADTGSTGDSGSHAGKLHYEEDLRKLLAFDDEGVLRGQDMFGMGYAGVSCWTGTPDSPGTSHMNATNVDSYFSAIAAGRFPAERGFQHDVEDIRLVWLFQQLQSMQVDARTYERAFGLNVWDEFEPIWSALSERGWVERSDGTIRIVGDGEFYIPSIQHLLSANRLDVLRTRARDAVPGLAGKGARRSKYVRPPREDRLVQISKTRRA